jgi:DinB superfamily
MNATSYARLQIEEAFGLMNTCAEGMDESQYNWAPGGTCNSIAKSHVHALTSIDFFVNIVAKGGAPMFWPEHGPKAGLPANPLEIWGFGGSVPLVAMKEYGQAVQKAALDYIGTLTDADLDRVIDTRFFGQQSLAFVIQLIGLHSTGHAGDISAVKGMQGLKGLPF